MLWLKRILTGCLAFPLLCIILWLGTLVVAGGIALAKWRRAQFRQFRAAWGPLKGFCGTFVGDPVNSAGWQSAA